MGKINMKYLLGFLICTCLIIGSLSFVIAENETVNQHEAESEIIITDEDQMIEITNTSTVDNSEILFDYGYEDYLKDNGVSVYPEETIVFNNSSAKLENSLLESSYEGENNIIFASNASSVEYDFDVNKSGMYSIIVTYNSLLYEMNRDYKYSLSINGQVPFESARYLSFSKLWKDIKDEETGRFIKDSRGNELTPRQEEVLGWQSRYVEDIEGFYSEPYAFYFPEGANTVKFEFQTGEIAIFEVALKELPQTISYDEYLDKHSDKKIITSDEFLLVEAELSYTKSDPVLHPRFDRSSPATSPQDPANLLLNTIGQNNWQYKGQWISWKVDAPEAGMYRVSLRARQNYVRGVRVSRRFYVNGEIPFSEIQTYYFPFNNRWYVETLGTEDDKYLVYLEEGENDIKIEVTPSFPVILRKLQENIFSLNETYRKIIMITGVSSSGNALDEFRDYNLDREIPEFMETLFEHLEELTELREEMTLEGFQKGGEVVVVEDLIRQVSSFIDDTDTIPTRLKMFKDNISAASSWVLRLKEQPLELDWIAFSGQNAKIPEAEAGFFRNAWFSIQTFFVSFINDYTTLDDGFVGEEVVEIWVGLGREQTELIKRLIDDYFIPEYGVRVNVNLVQQGLIPATLTGKGPDVAMFIPPSDIINLAARNALVEVQDFEGFDEVTKRFQKTSMIPYTYMNEVYALPISEGFTMMFYRRDVFNELGIYPPKTWTEFYDLILVLQRNNLTIGMPGDESTFQTLIFQYGGQYYRDKNWRETAFDTPEVLAAFRQWTDFYAKYSLPVAYDFYSRFRTGEMPLGIAPYVMYNQLNVAAPEIKGLWEMIPIPGVERDDGTVNNSTTGSGLTGITMFKKTNDKEGAWKLMKWWTSSEIQSRYGREIETILGPAGRFDTANVEAFRQLPWTQREEQQLLEQWDKIQMMQQTPVNYYISRHLQNAFRRVVIQGENHRETLNFYNRDINKEIIRKQIEFGLMD